MRPSALVTVLFLALVALAHLARLVLHLEITVDEVTVPPWVSWLAVIGPGALAIWLWRDRGRS
jgi:hypothetical protein